MSSNLKIKLPPQARNSLTPNDVVHLRRNSSNPGNKNSARKKNSAFKPDFSDRVKKLARKMWFRVKLYLMMNKAKKQVKTHLDVVNPAYNRLIRVLQNHFRSNANAEFVLEYLKQLSFFANFIRDLGDVSETAVTELCKCVRYEYMPAGNIVFREGDPSNDKFYVLLKGTVTVVKRKDFNVFVAQNRKLHKKLTTAPQKVMTYNTMKHIDGDEESKSGSEDESDSSSSKSSEELDPNSPQSQLKINELIESLGSKLTEMKEGEGFGEKALLAKCGKRTASIVTNTNCDFLVMMKKDYVDIITRYDKRRQAKMKFMTKHIPYLDSIVSNEIIENLFYQIKEADHSKGAVVALEGAPGKHLFFIQDGYCDIEKTIVSESTGKNPTYKIKRKLATFGPGSCLGEEVLLNVNPKYDYSIVVSSSSVKLYTVEKFNFISRFPRESTAALLEAYHTKEVIHKEKIKKIAENLGKLAGHPIEPLAKIDNFGQLMNSSLRNSVFSHLRMASNRSKGLQAPGSQVFDSPQLNPRELHLKPDDSPLLSARELKHPHDHAFSRALRPIPLLDKGFRGGSDTISGDQISSQTSPHDMKLYLNDDINQSSSPRARLKAASHSIAPTPGNNKRLEELITERRQSNKKLQAITNYENSSEKKGVLLGNNSDRLLFDKFDFGSPINHTKSVAKRFSIKQEKKGTGEISPQKTQYGAFEAYFNSQGPESAKLPKELKPSPRTTASASNFKIKSSTARDISWGRPNNLLQDKRNESARVVVTVGNEEKGELKTWSVEELDGKFMDQIGRVRTVMAGMTSKTDLEVSKKSITEIAKDLKKPGSQRLKERRRINDSLNQKKSREKFNIRMIKTFGRDVSPSSKLSDSLSLQLHLS